MKTLVDVSMNFMDWLKLDINTVGRRLSGLVVKRSHAKLTGSGFESREAGS